MQPPNPFGVVVRVYTDANCTDSAGYSAGWYANDTCIPDGAGGWQKFVCNGTAGAIKYSCSDNACGSCSIATRYTWPAGQDHKCSYSGSTFTSYIGCHATIGAPSGSVTQPPRAPPTPSSTNNGGAPTSPNNNRSDAIQTYGVVSLAFAVTFAVAAILL
jgi:hypothetical protein